MLLLLLDRRRGFRCLGSEIPIGELDHEHDWISVWMILGVFLFSIRPSLKDRGRLLNQRKGKGTTRRFEKLGIIAILFGGVWLLLIQKSRGMVGCEMSATNTSPYQS